jgi:hypothetical protein
VERERGKEGANDNDGERGVSVIEPETLLSSDNVDEEQRHGRVENDLKDGVDDDQDGTVVAVSSSEVIPDLRREGRRGRVERSVDSSPNLESARR